MELGYHVTHALNKYIEMAAAVPIKPLSDQTVKEMQYGRATVLRNITLSQVDEVCRKLNTAYPGSVISAEAVLGYGADNWTIGFTIVHDGQIVLAGKEEFEYFPSNEIKAYMLLLMNPDADGAAT